MTDLACLLQKHSKADYESLVCLIAPSFRGKERFMFTPLATFNLWRSRCNEEVTSNGRGPSSLGEFHSEAHE